MSQIRRTNECIELSTHKQRSGIRKEKKCQNDQDENIQFYQQYSKDNLLRKWENRDQILGKSLKEMGNICQIFYINFSVTLRRYQSLPRLDL